MFLCVEKDLIVSDSKLSSYIRRNCDSTLFLSQGFVVFLMKKKKKKKRMMPLLQNLTT
jgi:hypothetical protein